MNKTEWIASNSPHCWVQAETAAARAPPSVYCCEAAALVAPPAVAEGYKHPGQIQKRVGVKTQTNNNTRLIWLYSVLPI